MPGAVSGCLHRGAFVEPGGEETFAVTAPTTGRQIARVVSGGAELVDRGRGRGAARVPDAATWTRASRHRAGSEFVQFSPTGQLQAVEAAIVKAIAPLLARLGAAALAVQPLPAEQVRAGELGADPGPAQALDRRAIAAFGDLTVAEQGADAGFDPSAQSAGITRVRSDSHSNAAPTSATSPVLAAASASSGTIRGP